MEGFLRVGDYHPWTYFNGETGRNVRVEKGQSDVGDDESKRYF